MNRVAKACRRTAALLRERRAQLRLSLRVTVSVALAFIIAQALRLPLGGLWAILTAVVVTQMSVGGSLKAALEYSIGTVGGAIYAGAIAALVPHQSELALLGVLGLAVAPLALLAALNPNFRIGPFTAVLVVLGSEATHAGPIASASTRVLEVALGGGVGLLVSLLILPARAHVMANEAAADLIDLMASALPSLFSAFTRKTDRAAILRIQRSLGDALARFNAVESEATHERRVTRYSNPAEPRSLPRSLLRLRHDLIMIGRAGAAPLAEPLRDRLGPLLTRVGATADAWLRATSDALLAGRNQPPLTAVNGSIEDFMEEINALRRDGATRALPSDALEHLFALGFALEQLRENLKDLAASVTDCAYSSM
ncbi:FUSC family protein [Methylocapsa acidiphila]|uniref:FUSC family protein n=1 Tax=Methylocapsa acidiphila TaxID=133552 RepID=UPI000687D21B|nr:FUSC family protein [Methylocapsa acidiphila]